MQVEQCYGIHNIAGSNLVAAITLLPAIIRQLNIAAGNVMALHRYVDIIKTVTKQSIVALSVYAFFVVHNRNSPSFQTDASKKHLR